MQPWYFYVMIAFGAICSNLLYQLARRADGFESKDKLAKFGIRVVCFLVPAVLIFAPYTAWQLTGFRAGDARAAERQMVDRYLGQGAQAAEVHFIISGHSTMTGFASVTLTDGSVATSQCRADKASNGDDYLIFCQ